MSALDIYFRASDGEILGWVTGGAADPRSDCSISSVNDLGGADIVPDPKRQKIDRVTLNLVDKTPEEIALSLMPTLVEMMQLVYGELLSTDCFMVPDYPVAENERVAWKAYRQDLRELSNRPSPYEMLLAWPERPDGGDPSAALRLRMNER